MLLALNPAVTGDPDAALAAVDAFIDRVKSAPRRPDVPEILYPGEGSQRLRRLRLVAGEVAIPQRDYDAVLWMASLVGAEPPKSRSLNDLVAEGEEESP